MVLGVPSNMIYAAWSTPDVRMTTLKNNSTTTTTTTIKTTTIINPE